MSRSPERSYRWEVHSHATELVFCHLPIFPFSPFPTHPFPPRHLYLHAQTRNTLTYWSTTSHIRTSVPLSRAPEVGCTWCTCLARTWPFCHNWHVPHWHVPHWHVPLWHVPPPHRTLSHPTSHTCRSPDHTWTPGVKRCFPWLRVAELLVCVHRWCLCCALHQCACYVLCEFGLAILRCPTTCLNFSTMRVCLCHPMVP